MLMKKKIGNYPVFCASRFFITNKIHAYMINYRDHFKCFLRFSFFHLFPRKNRDNLTIVNSQQQKILHSSRVHSILIVKYTLLIFPILIQVFPASLSAQNFAAKNYPSFAVGHSQIYSLLEDSRGYLWIGTWGGGLSLYDGQTFKKFTGKKQPGTRYINTLLEDDQKNIIIGGAGNISIFDGQSFHTGPALPTNVKQINDLIQTPDKKIWVATDRGLFFLQKKQLIAVPGFPDNLNIEDLFLTKTGTLWIATTEGAYYFENNFFNKISTIDGLSRNHIRAITATDDGRIWLATTTGGIDIYHKGIVGRFSESNQFEEGLGINTISTDKKDRIWVGMVNEGVYCYHPKTAEGFWLRERTTTGLESDNIKVTLSDQWGNFWLGTSGGGLTRYAASTQQFTHYTEADGLADKEVYAISQDSSGILWIATSRGVSTFDNERFNNFSQQRNFADIKCRAILVDQKNQIWIGTEGDGLKLYDGSSYRQFQPWDGIEGNLIQDIIEDSLGNIWVAMMDAGIARLAVDDRDSSNTTYRIDRFTKKNGLPNDAIYDLHLDRLQRLWYASRGGGIGYIENDSTLLNFSMTDGLPSMHVRTLTEDSLGYLWGGTADNGIFNIHLYGQQPRFSVFGEQEGLSSNNIYSLIFSSNNRLWAGNQSGVDQIAVSSGRDEIGDVIFYGNNEGFKGGETCESAVLKDRETLWFGTIGGLMKYTPRELKKDANIPKIQITNVRLSYDSLQTTRYRNVLNTWGQVDSALTFEYNDNNVRFEYCGLHLGQSSALKYQWKMDGLTDDWSQPQTDQKSDFPYLPSGKYTFRVKAISTSGIGSPEQSVAFVIRTPFWQTWWFKTGSILLFIFLIGAFFFSRIRAIRQESRQKTERLEMEKHLLELEQKALQLQMNPHFIFNVLNTIQSKINATDHRDARYQLAKFSKLMRATLENSRVSTIPLEEEIQSLENYLAMEKMSRNNSFEYSIKLVGTTDSTTLIPPMLIQPFVENAIIHGVAHVPTGGKINVGFTQRNGFLEAMILDNGIGRTAAKKRKSQIKAQHKSVALAVTQERLELLGEQPGGLKRLEMEDIIEDGKVAGTRVLLRI